MKEWYKVYHTFIHYMNTCALFRSPQNKIPKSDLNLWNNRFRNNSKIRRSFIESNFHKSWIHLWPTDSQKSEHFVTNFKFKNWKSDKWLNIKKWFGQFKFENGKSDKWNDASDRFLSILQIFEMSRNVLDSPNAWSGTWSSGNVNYQRIVDAIFASTRLKNV